MENKEAPIEQKPEESPLGYRISIHDPIAERTYWHGEQYRDAPYGGPANKPNWFPTRQFAEWTAEACRSIGRIATVVPVEEIDLIVSPATVASNEEAVAA